MTKEAEKDVWAALLLAEERIAEMERWSGMPEGATLHFIRKTVEQHADVFAVSGDEGTTCSLCGGPASAIPGQCVNAHSFKEKAMMKECHCMGSHLEHEHAPWKSSAPFETGRPH